MNNEEKLVLRIDITSDNICRKSTANLDDEENSTIDSSLAWCYVGKRRLEKALAALDRSRVDVTIHWHPFELDGTLPRDGSLMKLDRYRQKFGRERVEQMLPAMIETGRKEGIEFSYEGPIGSTFDSHRLLFYVEKQPNGTTKQNQLTDLLFAASFEKEKDLSNQQLLTDLAEQIGFDRREIHDFLRSDLYVKEVKKEIAESHQRGVTGVPYFLFNKRFELSGAQEPHIFLQVFQKIGLPLRQSN